jgi:hypothetical protein
MTSATSAVTRVFVVAAAGASVCVFVAGVFVVARRRVVSRCGV